MNNLPPCPFCGGEAFLYTDQNVFQGQIYKDYPENHNTGYRIECEGPKKCHAMTCWWHTKEEAIEAWSNRYKFNEMKFMLETIQCYLKHTAPEIKLTSGVTNLLKEIQAIETARGEG